MFENIEILSDEDYTKEILRNLENMKLSTYKKIVLDIGGIILGDRDKLSVKDVLNLRITMQIISRLDIETQLNCIYSIGENMKGEEWNRLNLEYGW